MGSTLLLSQADIELLDSLKPICAHCRRRVNNLTWHRMPDRPMTVMFEVHCHGEVERTPVEMDRFHEIMNGAVQGAEAFREPPLLGDKV